MSFFIHKYADGKMVTFTKVPQVKHRNTHSLSKVKVGSYIKTLHGRIARVEIIFKRDVDVTKDFGDTPRIESKYFFFCRFLDNNESMELQAYITLSRVKVNFINLICYKIYNSLRNDDRKI